MSRPFAVLSLLATPGAALAHDVGAMHLHPHGVAEAWAMGFALILGAGAFAWSFVAERRK